MKNSFIILLSLLFLFTCIKSDLAGESYPREGDVSTESEFTDNTLQEDGELEGSSPDASGDIQEGNEAINREIDNNFDNQDEEEAEEELVNHPGPTPVSTQTIPTTS